MSRTASHNRLKASGLLATLVLVAIGLTSCVFNKSGEYLVPAQESAREQFAVAYTQEQAAHGLFDKDARNKETEKAILAYRKVEELFPADQEFTPVAVLKIAELKKEMGQHDKAIAEYEMLLQKYSDQDDIRSRSLFGMAVALDETKKPQEAQKYYKLLIDEYADSSDPEIQQIRQEAIAKHRVIREID